MNFDVLVYVDIVGNVLIQVFRELQPSKKTNIIRF